jgi:hypothetical protein
LWQLLVKTALNADLAWAPFYPILADGPRCFAKGMNMPFEKFGLNEILIIFLVVVLLAAFTFTFKKK